MVRRCTAFFSALTFHRLPNRKKICDLSRHKVSVFLTPLFPRPVKVSRMPIWLRHGSGGQLSSRIHHQSPQPPTGIPSQRPPEATRERGNGPAPSSKHSRSQVKLSSTVNTWLGLALPLASEMDISTLSQFQATLSPQTQNTYSTHGPQMLNCAWTASRTESVRVGHKHTSGPLYQQIPARSKSTNPCVL